MGFIASFIIALAFAVVGELLRPKQSPPNAKASSLDDFDIPTAEEGRSIPAFAGKVKFTGPNTTWYGDLEVSAIKKKVKTGWFSSKMQTLGYKYMLGMQLSIAHGRDDVYCHNIFFGEDVPRHTRSTEAGGVTRFQFDDNEFYGGNESEGGVVGTVRFYPGNNEQPANAYFGAQIGEEAPAYHGLCHAILEHVYLGTSHYIKTISLELSSYPNQLGMASDHHRIVDDSNPACMIYEIMTNVVWGVGMAPSDIDVTAFRAVGETLYSEGYGMSMIYNGGTTARSLIEEILRHVDGVMFSDPQTGLVTLRLARADYDVNMIPQYNENDFGPEGIKFSRPSWSETKNHIKGTYIDREHDYSEAVVAQQDLANIIQRGGEVAYEQQDFTGFTRYDPASKAVARALKTLSYPLAKVSGSLPRSAWKTKPGDVFRLSWDNLNIRGAVFRIIRVDYGTLANNRLEIEAVEDIFAISSVAYAEPPPSGWTNPVGDMAPLVRQAVIEAPAFGAPGPERYVMTLGSKADQIAFGYEAWADDTGGTSYTYRDFISVFTPSAVLSAPYTLSRADTDEVGFTVHSLMHGDLIDQGDADSRRNGLNLVVIGGEWLAWSQYVNNGDGTHTFKGVWSGVLDTVPQTHAPGEVVWFVSEGAGLLDDNGYNADKNLNVKFLPKTMGKVLPIASATNMNLVTNSRAVRPLPPGKVRVNGQRPVDISSVVTGPFTVSWVHRNTFDPYVRSQSDDSQSPDQYTPRYNIRVFNNITNVVIVEAEEAYALSAEVALTYDGEIRVEIETTVDGSVSWMKQVFVLDYEPGDVTEDSLVIDEIEVILDGGGA